MKLKLFVLFHQVWLSRLSEEMKDTLKELLVECLKDAKQSKGGLDPNKYPSQVSQE